MSSHEQFVSTKTGCEQYEIFAVLTIAPFAILLRNLALPWIFLGRRFTYNDWGLGLKFFLDFAVIVLPFMLALSFFAASSLFILLILMLCILMLLLFVFLEFTLFMRERPPIKGLLQKIIEEHHHPTTFLTYLRSLVLIFTNIAILAVDFPVFPRRFAKTSHYGHSVMDVGVAAFIYILAVGRQLKTQGMRDRQEKRGGRFRRAFASSTAFLIYLGIGRTLLIKGLGYPEVVSEYGLHWNFFYTFFIVQVVAKFLPKRFHALLAILFATAHQLLLSSGYEEWALSEDAPRTDFISANREGFCSLLGYIAMYYFASSIGKFITSTGCRLRNWIQCCAYLFLLAGFFFVLQKGAEMAIGAPSRRITNLSYIFAQLSLFTYGLAICLGVQVVAFIGWAANVPHFGTDENPWEGVQPCLLDSVNKMGFLFFLIGNVFTDLNRYRNFVSCWRVNGFGGER
ncbi:unnamed protein product, partial [Mesorhabditis belari]|uniref:Phosphatidylinositol-glycan biosynthesis class W protein n=1 Tax=Mesorhabditis belari TaxID=2138241 RepID=A0AAF3FH12_9BILA